MVQGPQRKGFPNRVDTPHGQTLGRQSDTEYTHAVVHTTATAGVRERLTGEIGRLEHTIANIDDNPAYVSRLRKANKELAGLPESEQFSSLVSMHQSSREAEKRRTRESGRGTGYSVLRVRQDD